MQLETHSPVSLLAASAAHNRRAREIAAAHVVSSKNQLPIGWCKRDDKLLASLAEALANTRPTADEQL